MAEHKLKELEVQLKAIGCNFRFWGRSELKELANVLLPGEVVKHCVNGSYEGGFALLAATDQRVLLIDKKPFYLTLEDVRFDMISEIDYNHRLLNSTVLIQTPNKSLRFVGYNQYRLRQLFHFVQTKVMEIRQHYQHQGQMWKDYADSLQSSQIQGGQAPQQQQPAFDQPMTAQFNMPAAVATTPNFGTNQANQSPEFMAGTGGVPQASHMPHRPTPPPMPTHPIAPIVSAYTRLPMMSRQRRFLGSRAVNAPISQMYSAPPR